jgi:hypothetical protein
MIIPILFFITRVVFYTYQTLLAFSILRFPLARARNVVYAFSALGSAAVALKAFLPPVSSLPLLLAVLQAPPF